MVLGTTGTYPCATTVLELQGCAGVVDVRVAIAAGRTGRYSLKSRSAGTNSLVGFRNT